MSMRIVIHCPQKMFLCNYGDTLSLWMENSVEDLNWQWYNTKIKVRTIIIQNHLLRAMNNHMNFHEVSDRKKVVSEVSRSSTIIAIGFILRETWNNINNKCHGNPVSIFQDALSQAKVLVQFRYYTLWFGTRCLGKILTGIFMKLDTDFPAFWRMNPTVMFLETFAILRKKNKTSLTHRFKIILRSEHYGVIWEHSCSSDDDALEFFFSCRSQNAKLSVFSND